MQEKRPPSFEAYISIDVPEPFNNEIYKIREIFSDKKMMAMPVDIPLFGHFDETMTLMKNYKEFYKSVERAISKIDQVQWSSKDLTIEASHYVLDESNNLMILLRENAYLKMLRKEIIDDLHHMKIEIAGEDLFEYRPVLYIVTRPNVNIDLLKSYHEKKVDLQFKLKRMSFYQKEAIPLTRVDSWII